MAPEDHPASTTVVMQDPADTKTTSTLTNETQLTMGPQTTDTMPASGETSEKAQAANTGKMTNVALYMLMTALILIMFLAMLDMSIIGTAIPDITSDFHRLEDVGWYVGAYQLASATVQPLAGKLYLHLDTKWTYLCFCIIFILGSALCGAAQSSNMLITGRAIGGLGTSGISNGAMIFFVELFPNDKRPFYTSIVMGIGQIGIILGPLLGGIFTEYASWRWSFYINLPIGFVACVFLIAAKVPPNSDKPPFTFSFLRSLLPQLDLFGFALFTPAAVMFLVALQYGSSSDYNWDSPEVIGLFCGGGVAAILFLAWEWRKGDDAMIPLAIVSRRSLWTSSMNFALIMSATICAATFMPIYFQSVRGLTPTMSGVYLLAGILPQIAFILIAGALMQRLGYYIPWALLAATGTAIGCGLASTWVPETSLGQLIGYQMIYALRGAGIQIGITAIQSTLPPREASIGTSFLVFCQNFLSATLVGVANVIFQETLVSEIRSSAPDIDPDAAIGAGGSAAAVRSLAPPGSSSFDALLNSYCAAFASVMYLVVGIAFAAFLTSFGMGWVDLRTLNPSKKEEESTKENA